MERWTKEEEKVGLGWVKTQRGSEQKVYKYLKLRNKSCEFKA